MTLTLYGIPASRAFRVLWAIYELDVPFEHVDWHYADPRCKTPDFLAINPNGTIPAVVDDGVPLFESLAINLYLARKHGKLWPREVAGEGRAFQWTLWAATEVEPAIGDWAYHSFFLPEPERDGAIAARGGETLAAKLDVLERVLAGRQWLADEAFGIADLNVAAVLYRGPMFGLARWPSVKAWHARCYARPAAMRAVADRERKA